MNEMHEANRRSWDALSAQWQTKVDEAGIWRRCHREPELYLAKEELTWLRGLNGKRVAVLGSGDNQAAFCISGLGGKVTSVDISQAQLDCGKARAAEMELSIDFVRADVTDLSDLPSGTFDAVYTGGHVAVWVSDLPTYYAESARLLAPGGLFIISEYHPFRRVFHANSGAYEVENPYLDRGPFEWDRAKDIQDNALGAVVTGSLPTYEFHWTISDFINSVIASGCDILDCREYGDRVDAWEGLPPGDIPEVFLIVSRKRQTL